MCYIFSFFEEFNSISEEEQGDDLDFGSTPGGGDTGGVFSPTVSPATGNEVTSFPPGGAPDGADVDEGSTDDLGSFTPPTVNPMKITSTALPIQPPKQAPVYIRPIITQSILVGEGVGVFCNYCLSLKETRERTLRKDFDYIFD